MAYAMCSQCSMMFLYVDPISVKCVCALSRRLACANAVAVDDDDDDTVTRCIQCVVLCVRVFVLAVFESSRTEMYTTWIHSLHSNQVHNINTNTRCEPSMFACHQFTTQMNFYMKIYTKIKEKNMKARALSTRSYLCRSIFQCFHCLCCRH